jgi:4-amino-4-deoxy-L-arabinose transferase-like glycosyltransferase
VVTKALVRGQLTVKAGLSAGVLLALGMLTRHFVLATTVAMLATLGVYYLFTRRRDALRMAGLIAISVVVLTSPWYIHQQVKHGDAFAASATPPNKPFFDRQPGGFYLGGTVKGVFTQPYRPEFDNHLPQTVYADWWGDYFLYFDVPSTLRRAHIAAGHRLHNAPRLPARYHNERVRQSFVGVLPTLLTLAGLFGLIRLGIRRRAAHLLAIPLLVGATALEALWVYIGYPTSDGDIMRQTYLLTLLPPMAFALGWLISRIRDKSTLAFGLVVGALGVAAVVDLNFIVLHHFVGRGT